MRCEVRNGLVVQVEDSTLSQDSGSVAKNYTDQRLSFLVCWLKLEDVLGIQESSQLKGHQLPYVANVNPIMGGGYLFIYLPISKSHFTLTVEHEP